MYIFLHISKCSSPLIILLPRRLVYIYSFILEIHGKCFFLFENLFFWGLHALASLLVQCLCDELKLISWNSSASLLKYHFNLIHTESGSNLFEGNICSKLIEATIFIFFYVDKCIFKIHSFEPQGTNLDHGGWRWCKCHLCWHGVLLFECRDSAFSFIISVYL